MEQIKARNVSVGYNQINYVPTKFENMDENKMNKCINRLIYGMEIKKMTKKGNGRPHKRIFYIFEEDLTKLQWLSDRKLNRDTRIDLRTVSRITEVPTAMKAKAQLKYDKNLILSIHYGNDQEIVLLFEDSEAKMEWWCGLQYFVQKAISTFRKHKEVMTDLAQDIFHRADTSGSKTLSRDEIKKMFKELQMSISKKELNDLIARYDKDKSGEISFDEFKEMITELLRKQELVPLFKQYAKEYQANVYDAPAMTLNELVNFMRKEQKQETSIRNLLTLSDNFKGKDPDEPCISFDDFVAIIFSMRNIILNPEHSYVYQVINAIL